MPSTAAICLSPMPRKIHRTISPCLGDSARSLAKCAHCSSVKTAGILFLVSGIKIPYPLFEHELAQYILLTSIVPINVDDDRHKQHHLSLRSRQESLDNHSAKVKNSRICLRGREHTRRGKLMLFRGTRQSSTPRTWQLLTSMFTTPSGGTARHLTVPIRLWSTARETGRGCVGGVETATRGGGGEGASLPPNMLQWIESTHVTHSERFAKRSAQLATKNSA